MSLLFYKRPKKVAKADGHLTDLNADCKNGDACQNLAIPPTLSFENVICNKCSPPCSLQDFLDYLTYVSHDAENLQFYLWMIDYFQRFRRIPKMQRALSPRWTGRAPPIREQDGLRLIATHDVDIMSEDISDCDTWGGYEVSEFTDQYTQTLDDIKFSISPVKPQQRREEQYVWYPAEEQPLRREISRIVNHYLLPGSPRQLNLSHNDRATVLRALEYTTHPSALSPIKRMLDSTLRKQSHPNFIRWSLCNGNRSYIIFLRLFAAFMLFIGIMISILLVLSHASRFFRILAAPFIWFGITNGITASRGLCVLLHRLHTRQNHPWETPSPVPSEARVLNPFYSSLDDDEMYKPPLTSTISPTTGAISYESTRSSHPVKMEVFGPSNNYSGESWVRNHGEKSWWRRLFDRRVKVQEGALGRMQTRMVRQAEAWAALATIIIVIIFVILPEVGAI